jgi:hypothetical protein
MPTKKRRKLTRKQIEAGFGGKRRKSAIRHTRKSSAVHAKSKKRTVKRKTTKKKTGTSGVIANNAVLNDLIVGAGGAALGYTAKTLQDNFGTKGIASLISGGISAVKNAINYLEGNKAPVTPLTTTTAINTSSLVNPNPASAYPGASGAVISPANQALSDGSSTIINTLQAGTDLTDTANPLPVGITQEEANALLLDPATANQVVAAPNNPDNTIFNFVPGPGFNTKLG